MPTPRLSIDRPTSVSGPRTVCAAVAILLLAGMTMAEEVVPKQPAVRRFQENPIIRPAMLPGRDGENIAGPTLIRVPAWVKMPLGKYYLYFAHHHGKYIRLAYADRLEGPWTIYEPGALSLADVQAVAGTDKPKPSGMIPGVNAPNVHVDQQKQQIRMYFSTGVPGWGHVSAVALSTNGLEFKPEPEPLGGPYFRVFQWQGGYYAIDRFGCVSRSPDGLSSFELLKPAGIESLAAGRKSPVKGPWGAIRHTAVLVEGDRLSVFFSRYGDTPESIMLARIELADDPSQWKISKPMVILEPEMKYEGGDLPLERSRSGAVHQPVRQLRSPAVFQEEGRTYLLYSVAGESGIAVAEYRE